MKKSLLVLALVTAAGAAAAQTVTTPSVGSGTVTTPSVGSGTATTPTPMQPPTTSMPSATAPTAPGMAPSATPPSVATTPPASGAMAPGEAQARARIERDGYKSVSGLTKGPDGMWRGMAMRGSTSVQVMVDARGNVITE